MQTSILFHTTVFMGAFLLFMIQPILGKYLLPWYGGSPAVWATCLLFFQTVLLGGYAYAHALNRLTPRRQAGFHAILLLAAVVIGLVLLRIWGNPILPAAALKPSTDAAPVWSILKLLTIGIGLSYFLLSANASLLQAWYYRVEPGKSVYAFYIISNTGSLLALLSYPFFVEPALPLRTQAFCWSGAFLLYAACCISCALRLRPTESTRQDQPAAWAAAPPRKTYAYWLLLSACGVLMLMSVTNQMTVDVPPVPFLWILPLALFLLSYIIGFIDRLAKHRTLFNLLPGIAGVLAWYLLYIGGDHAMPMQIALYSIILFSVCLFCHHSLYRTRPHPSHLTGFYLCISIGGALGGLFVAVFAPRIFNDYWEYPLSLGLALMLAAGAISKQNGGRFRRVRRVVWIPALALAIAVSYHPYVNARGSLHRSRNFFGTLRIERIEGFAGPMNTLYHGSISHGAQYVDPVWSDSTTTYYTESSGVGQAIDALRTRRQETPLHLGVVGLGCGTLATYGRQGDHFRLYEINPQVVALAKDPGHFTYLQDSEAELDIILGDARLQLEHEFEAAGPHGFDLLVLDAFNGDSPPAHLLTKEAFELYLHHLAPDGLLAVHISNRYINFMPLMRAVMEEFNLCGILNYNPAYDDDLGSPSDWVIFSTSPTYFSEALLENDTADDYPGKIRIWTDDYSNLLSLFW